MQVLQHSNFDFQIIYVVCLLGALFSLMDTSNETGVASKALNPLDVWISREGLHMVIARSMINSGSLQRRTVRSGHCEFTLYHRDNINNKWHEVTNTDIVATALPSRGHVGLYGIVKLTDFKLSTNKKAMRSKAVIISYEKVILTALCTMYAPELEVVATETWFDRGQGSPHKCIQYMVDTHKLQHTRMGQAIIRSALKV